MGGGDNGMWHQVARGNIQQIRAFTFQAHTVLSGNIMLYIGTYMQSVRLNSVIETVACQEEPIL